MPLGERLAVDEVVWAPNPFSPCGRRCRRSRRMRGVDSELSGLADGGSAFSPASPSLTPHPTRYAGETLSKGEALWIPLGRPRLNA
jgi:hypothetical protein